MSARRRSWTVTWVEYGVLFFLLLVVTAALLPAITPAFEAERRVMCQDNLRQLGMAFLIYANEDAAGRLPRMHGYERFAEASNLDGCVNVFDDFDFGPDTAVLYPDLVRDPLVFVCPSGPHGKRPWLLFGSIRIGSNGYRDDARDATGLVRDDGSSRCEYAGHITNGDVSYTYLPWVVSNDTPGFYESPVIDEDLAAAHGLPMSGPAQLVALAIRLQRAQSLAGEASTQMLDEDIDLTELFGMLGEPYIRGGCDTGRERQTVLRRTTDHVERELVNPPASYLGRNVISQAVIPVLFDRVSHGVEYSHVPPGGNVLYLDAHVEFVRYPQRFPMSEVGTQLLVAVEQEIR